MEHPASLLTEWRERAARLQQFGDPNSARLWMLAAAELERALATVADETLSLVEAARISGLTPDYLGRLVKTGKVTNVGRPGAPRIRRADLPEKKPNSKESQGRVAGPRGAAAKLGIPRQTVEWKIRSLKIDKLAFRQR